MLLTFDDVPPCMASSLLDNLHYRATLPAAIGIFFHSPVQGQVEKAFNFVVSVRFGTDVLFVKKYFSFYCRFSQNVENCFLFVVYFMDVKKGFFAFFIGLFVDRRKKFKKKFLFL